MANSLNLYVHNYICLQNHENILPMKIIESMVYPILLTCQTCIPYKAHLNIRSNFGSIPVYFTRINIE